MTKLKASTILIALFGIFCSPLFAQLPKSFGDLKKTAEDALKGNKLSTEEVVAGLKEALVKGTGKGTSRASKLDGYYKNPVIKIPFPKDANKVESSLRQIGMGDQVDRFVMTLNRGAEQAAREAKPIFVSAIKSMTVADGWSILKGEDNAATKYLNKSTNKQLKIKFKPIIKKSLESTQATKYYSDLVGTYNKIPFVSKVNPSLDDYATDMAIRGLFKLIAQEEAKIRKEPLARTSDLLKKVFSQQ